MDGRRTALASGRYGTFEGLLDDAVVFGHYREHGDWSPALIDLVCDRLRPATVLDVGANIGLFSVPVAQRSEARCLAFEPVADNYALLRANVERHGMGGRVLTRQVAVYSQRAQLTMALSPDNSGDHHVSERATSARTVGVEADTLDALLAGEALSPPVVMKIDTQGSELRVIKGASGVLPQVDHCIVEYWPAGLSRLGDRPRALRDALDGFAYAALLPQDGGPVELSETAQLWARLDYLSDDDPGFFDVLLTRTAELPGGGAGGRGG